MRAMPLKEKWTDFRSRDGEDGSGGGMSLVLLLCAVALLVVLGLVVDGGTKAQALDRANRIAMEAAAAGAQAVTTGGGDVNAAAADAAVQNYLAAEGVTGDAQIQANRVDVAVTLTTPTKMLSMVGIDEITVTGDGYANVIYTLEG
jgi:Flp pilus assembly protein TadG